MIYWLAALQTIPAELYEAAKVDGAGGWAIFRRITVPLLTPFTVIITLITVVQTLRVFPIVQSMTGGGPFFASEVMEVYIYRTAFGTGGIPPPRLRLGGGGRLRPHDDGDRDRAGLGAAAGAGRQPRARYSGRRGAMSTLPTTGEAASVPVRQTARTRPSWRSGGRLRATIVSIILFPLCFFWIYPFLWMASASLKTQAEIFSGLGLIPKSLQWSNFARAWTQAHIGRYFLNTVIITVASVAIVVITTALIGYVLGALQLPRQEGGPRLLRRHRLPAGGLHDHPGLHPDQ